MNVITRRRLLDFANRHPDASESLDRWYRVAHAARWQSLDDLRQTFPHADLARVASGNTVTVFNVGGNKFRLVAAIHYNRQRVYVLRILTHAEYDRESWKAAL